MQLTPAREECPIPYPEDRVLRSPLKPLTYEYVRERICRFSQESIVTIGTRILWQLFANKQAAESLGHDVLRTIQICAEKVVSVSLVAGPQKGAVISENEFSLLCWEFFAIPGELQSPTGGASALMQCLRRDFTGPRGEAFLALGATRLMAAASVARVVALNVDSRWLGFDDLLTAATLVDRVFDDLEAHCGSRVDVVRRSLLSGGPSDFVRNQLVLFTAFQQGVRFEGQSTNERGVADLGGAELLPETQRRLGVTIDGIRFATLTLSRALSSFANAPNPLFDEGDGWSSGGYQSAALQRWPIVDFEFGGVARRMFAPNPVRLVSAVRNYLLYDLPTRVADARLEDFGGSEINGSPDIGVGAAGLV